MMNYAKELSPERIAQSREAICRQDATAEWWELADKLGVDPDPDYRIDLGVCLAVLEMDDDERYDLSRRFPLEIMMVAYFATSIWLENDPDGDGVAMAQLARELFLAPEVDEAAATHWRERPSEMLMACGAPLPN